MTDRRADLAEAATDYVLEHGILGLSLRPLAAALGTSDRMLLYHFADKDDLVAELVRISTARSTADLRALSPSADPEAAVNDLWRVTTSPHHWQCNRLYAEASLLGVLGTEPYASLVADSDRGWLAAVSDHLVASGVPADAAPRLTHLVDAAFTGLTLLPSPDDVAAQVVPDLARAVAELARASTLESAP